MAQETYANDVIRERMVGPPSLIEGETVELNVKHGYPITLLIVSILITFIPPFLWGPTLFLLLYFQKKHDRVWVTNKRLVDFRKDLISNKYTVISVPLQEISAIRHARGGCLPELVDRLFGVGDVQVFVKDSNWVQCSIMDIKSPGELIKYIRQITETAKQTPGHPDES